jgi:hypothetical protein
VAVAVIVLACAASARAEPPRLGLVWVDPTAMARGAFGAVASESRRALAPIGATVTWSEAAHDTLIGPESLAVIAIPSAVNAAAHERHVMGATRTESDGAIAVWVFPDQVAWALGLDLGMRHSWGKITERNFARALARVASHEILHALGALGHARGGLMAPSLDRQALTAPMVRVDRATVAIARRALDGGTLSASRTWPSPLPGIDAAALSSAALGLGGAPQ